MSKRDVLAKVGNPLYVESGINNTIVWIYEVRLTKVQSDTNQRTKKQIYKKSNSNTIQSDPIHRLQVVFVDNKVEKWEMDIKKEKKIKVKTETTKKKVEKKTLNYLTVVNYQDKLHNIYLNNLRILKRKPGLEKTNGSVKTER